MPESPLFTAPADAQRLIGTLHEPVLVLDEDFRVLQANAAFYDSFSTTPEETRGTVLFDCAGGAWDVSSLRDPLRRLVRDGTAFEHLEVDRPFPECGRRALHVNGRRLGGDRDAPPRILLTIDDVTEKQKLKTENQEHADELQRVEREYQTLLGNVHVALFLLRVRRAGDSSVEASSAEPPQREEDPRFEFVRISESEEARKGRANAEVRGKTPREVFEAETGAALEARCRRCVRRQEVLTYEEEHDVLAEPSTWHTRLTPVVEANEVTYLVGMSREISARREAEQTVQESEERLRGLANSIPGILYQF